MIYSIFVDKDATIYSGSSDVVNSVGIQNTGLDEILEIEKLDVTALEELGKPKGVENFTLSRALLKFDLAEVSRSIVNGNIGTNIRFYLNLYAVEADEIPLSYTLYAYPLSQSWNMGVGRKHDFPVINDGVTWFWTDTSGSTTWSGSMYGGVYMTGSGGNTYAASQSFEYESSDIRMDVTDIVRFWLSCSLNTGWNYLQQKYVEGLNTENHGIILKRAGSEETDLLSYGSLKFFSRDSHTIYQPKLEVCWDDSTWSVGSLTAIDSDEDIVLYMKGLKKEYKENSKTKFRVIGRERYATKLFASSSALYINPYSTITYLPTSSYYSIRDAKTEEVIIPFDDNYTKLSCDSNGNYFNLWLDGLQPERYYRFVFKVERSSTTEEYFDNGFIFKVVK